MLTPSRSLYLLVLVYLLPLLPSQAETPPPTANSDPTYQQLRNVALATESFTVDNLVLQRDAAKFRLRSGTVCFVSPVQGKVTGAVFVGDGNLILEPPLPVERGMLKLLTKETEFSENFGQLVLRFTDSTYEEIKRAGAPGAGTCDPGLLKDTQSSLRHDRMLKGDLNLDARILQDVLSTEPGGLFVAFIRGKRYSGKELLFIDPHGAPGVAPEEISFSTYDESKYGIWAAFHYSKEYQDGTASGTQENRVLHIEAQKLDTTIEKSANLIGNATTTFVARTNGLRVVPFDLFRTLRVQSVTGANGLPLSFIQEDKDDDANFSVILPKALVLGEKYTITTSYAGKEAIRNEGGGNYFPIARSNWYPNADRHATYEMTFRIPKGMKIAVSGSLVNESTEGNQYITAWKSEGPQTLAGFNFGRFKMQEVRLNKPEYLVQSYANEEPPDDVRALLHAVNNDTLPSLDTHISGVALGTMSTLPMIKKALAEGQISIQLYTDYFGPLPFKRLAMSQQTECAAGQSWPALVWMPMCAFYDSTIRHQLGFGEDRGFWRSVGPHEVAHQWWGHQVGWTSYRDQWMSEGFADLSASIFIQLVEKNPAKFIQFWNDERDLMLERNKEGYRAIDAGPLTMGYRLSNERSGYDIYRRLIYPKGAYILHMIRMMMWNSRTGDQQFKETMQDFVRTYAGKNATTEDFKAIVEKHMTPDMVAIAGGNNMDWFFNEYVYGTALPSYKFDQSFETGPDGKIMFNFKLTQSDVDDSFRMLVPVYFELNDGRVVPLGRIRISGNNTISQQTPMPGLKEKPKRALINYMDDVLASD